VRLRVVEPGESADLASRQPLIVEQDRGGGERPGQATAPGLVRAGNEPVPELTIESK
jgi:hypothetical protein